MTVGELIEALRACNPEDTVYLWEHETEDSVELDTVTPLEDGGVMLSAEEEEEG